MFYPRPMAPRLYRPKRLQLSQSKCYRRTLWQVVGGSFLTPRADPKGTFNPRPKKHIALNPPDAIKLAGHASRPRSLKRILG